MNTLCSFLWMVLVLFLILSACYVLEMLQKNVDFDENRLFSLILTCCRRNLGAFGCTRMQGCLIGVDYLGYEVLILIETVNL